MSPSEVPDSLRGQVSDLIAGKLGLHYPPARWLDLQRGLASAARELGAANVTECALGLLSPSVTKAQMQVLARHLTIGETYFFREKKSLDALVERVLPKLLYARRKERRLRIWSAACCTGEEAYSLAILLGQVIPNISEWNVTILATDINEQFLKKAEAGVYGEWSFRDGPDWLKGRYFRPTTDGRHALLPEIKNRVTFAPLNLVEDTFPSLATDTNAMDVIFCRNVLMYFTLPQARKAIGNLRHALVDDGWLVVSPSESSQVLFSDFATENFPGVIFYRKGTNATRVPSPPPWESTAQEEPPPFLPPFVPPREAIPPIAAPELTSSDPSPEKSAPTPLEQASASYAEGRYAETVELLLTAPGPAKPAAPASFSLLARALANLGRLAEALAWCERWIAADKLDPSAHYLRAMVLQELADRAQAKQALQRAIYVDQNFVLGHFALGNLARDGGQLAEAGKHFANALRLLHRCAPGDELPEAEGLTAGRLTEIIGSITAVEATP